MLGLSSIAEGVSKVTALTLFVHAARKVQGGEGWGGGWGGQGGGDIGRDVQENKGA